MSLDVGVVKIDYLPVPGFPVEQFFFDLILDPESGLDDDDDDEDEYWDGGGGYGNAYYEFTRDGLVKRANGWAAAQNLGDAARSNLLNWIENLPYRSDSDTIMLHLSV